MNLIELLRAGDWLNQRSVVDLFRLGHQESEARDRNEAIRILDERSRLTKKRYEPSGVLMDGVKWLATCSYDDRFEHVMDLMRAASSADDAPFWPDRDVAESIADLCGSKLPVIFSFEQALPSCLVYAKRIKESAQGIHGPHPSDAVRFAGLDAEVPMLAYAALYLQLPIRVEPGWPWEDGETIDGDGNPYERPRLAIAMPSTSHKARDDGDMAKSAKRTGLPRMVDRNRIDIESAALFHYSQMDHPSLVFVSADVLSAARQSKWAVRIALRKNQVVRRIVEISKPVCRNLPHPVFVIELGGIDNPVSMVSMRKADTIGKGGFLDRSQGEFKGKMQDVSILDIQSSGDNLLPSRYLSKSTRKIIELTDVLKFVRSPEKIRLADVFEVIRPKILQA